MPETISNTSPIQYLYQADLLELLPTLYGAVIIPGAVAQELAYCVKQNVDYPQGVGRAAGCDFGGFDETVASRSASTPQVQASAPAGGATRTILSDSISDADR